MNAFASPDAEAPARVCLVLHGHLPYVHHPAHADFLEEDWFFEACVETYLPLLFILEDLAQDGVAVRIAVGITPPLLAMAAKFSAPPSAITSRPGMWRLATRKAPSRK